MTSSLSSQDAPRRWEGEAKRKGYPLNRKIIEERKGADAHPIGKYELKTTYRNGATQLWVRNACLSVYMLAVFSSFALGHQRCSKLTNFKNSKWIDAKNHLFITPLSSKPFTATCSFPLLSCNNTTTNTPLLVGLREMLLKLFLLSSFLCSLTAALTTFKISPTIFRSFQNLELLLNATQGKCLQTVLGFRIVSPTSLVQCFMLDPMTSSTSMRENGRSFRVSIFTANLFPLWERVQDPLLSIVPAERNGTFIILPITFKGLPLLLVMVSKLSPFISSPTTPTRWTACPPDNLCPRSALMLFF